MTNELILLKPAYLELGEQLFKVLSAKDLFTNNNKIVITISGESGCGKSVTAKAMQQALTAQQITSVVLAMDNYFLLPPKLNHNSRILNINQVGMQEVNLNLLQTHLNAFKAGSQTITLPLTNYETDRFDIVDLNFSNSQVLIIEGTYVYRLQNVDYSVFIERTYHQTKQARTERNRDIMTDFVEQVLEIEHQIIKQGAQTANLIIDTNYQIHQA
jgi:uridine kinase